MPTIRSPRPSASSISVEVDLIVTTRSGGDRRSPRDAAVRERRRTLTGESRRDGGRRREQPASRMAAAARDAGWRGTIHGGSQIDGVRQAWRSSKRDTPRGPAVQIRVGAPGQGDQGTSMPNRTRPHRENGRVPLDRRRPAQASGSGKSRLGPTPSSRGRSRSTRSRPRSRALRVGRLVVVTADETLAGAVMSMHGHGEVIIEDEPAGIAAAIASGARHIRPNTAPRAALLGDLPGLQPADLDVAADARCRRGSRVRRGMPRAPGRRSSRRPRGRAVEEHFGAGSAERAPGHGGIRRARRSRSGSTLRHDVDDAGQLEALARWGSARGRRRCSGTPLARPPIAARRDARRSTRRRASSSGNARASIPRSRRSASTTAASTSSTSQASISPPVATALRSAARPPRPRSRPRSR